MCRLKGIDMSEQACRRELSDLVHIILLIKMT